MNRPYLILLPVTILFASCQTPGTRSFADQSEVSPGFEQTEIVDISVLRPNVVAAEREFLEPRLRRAIRMTLLDGKGYSVPTDEWIETVILEHPTADTPAGIASAAGSDAALLLTLDQWDTNEFLPKGRIYAGGRATLMGKDGTTLWQRTFQDWMRLAPKNVTGANRADVTDEMLRTFAQDILSKLPAKVRR
jgi:hypothetical protein